MRVKIAPLAALAAATAVLVTGCGTGSAEEPAPEQAAGDVAVVDASTLDTGDFRTTPQTEFTTIGDDFLGRSIEGQRMAEYVVNPIEIDPQLTDLTPMSTYVVKDGKSLSILLPDPIPQAAVDHNMLAGFSSARSTAGREGDQSLINAVLRFPDATTAQNAATALHEATMNNDYGTGLPQAGAIDVLPSTLVSNRETAGEIATNAFTPYNEYVLYQWTNTPVADKEWAAKTIAKTVRDQGPLIEKFAATAPGDFANIKVDVDSVLRLTVPTERTSTSEFAVYGPRGASHFANDPATKLAMFESTGTTRQAVDQTTVYLSQTEEGSKKLAEQMGAAFETSGGLTPTTAPANVPNAECWTKDTPQGVGTKCLVQHGQYVGEITTMDDERKAHQLTAAQYLILTSPK